MDPRDAQRLKDLRAARKRANESDFLSLEHLAQLWGVTKPRFVTVMKEMVGMPAPQPAPKEMGLSANSHAYPALPAIDAMIAFATRHEDDAKERAARTAAIVGGSRGGPAAALFKPSELATLSRLAADTEERERQQGMYVPATEVARVVGDVFSLISDFCAALPNKIDPHGELPPSARENARKGVADLQLQLYQHVKHLLASDAVHGGNRETPGRARQPRARRKRG